MNRTPILEHLHTNPNVPVLIAGGGINGVGLLRELALQGVPALLVEKSDFGAGASAASTRIIHGGLRYLENGEFRLVRESLHERNRLLHNAPHYVRPLPITIPIYNRLGGMIHAAKKFFRLRSKPGGRGALLVKIGLSLYDLLTRTDRAVPTHWFTSRKDSLAQRPPLDPDIICTATYYDASITHPERLCLELVLDAEAACDGAFGLNYVSVVGASGGSVTLRDELTGATFDVQPQIVVNATGAWIDFTNQAMHRDTRMIGGTKGSHLVINHPELYAATQGHMLYFENTDGRICIFYPFYDRVIAGSTDLPVDDPEKAVCDEDEVEYILASIRQVFPGLEVSRAHVLLRFCGVRPLPRTDATTTGQISRDHSNEYTPPGNGIDFPVYSLVGGKWTTFRAFAEQVTDTLLPLLNKTRRANSKNLAIGGGKNYPVNESDQKRWLADQSAQTGLTIPVLTALLERYGTRAERVAAYCAAQPERRQPLHARPEYLRGEILFMLEHEAVQHVDDILLRRTVIALRGLVTGALIVELAEIVGTARGWSAQQITDEVERTRRILETRFGYQESVLEALN